MPAEFSEEYAIFPASHLLDSTSVHSGNDALYTPLTTRQHEFRLIEILPQTKDNARIQVRATIRDLQRAAGTYTAFSYTWGRPDTACTIELNGRAVNIRKNLWRFLHQARCSASLSGKLFWVDSLSINQTNEAERSHQVGLMAQIYSQAEQVLVWLGPAYDNSSAAMGALRRYEKHKSIARDIWWKSDAAALRGICERVYWTRLWVLQELALAKRAIVMCGQDGISWTTFKAFFVDAQRHTPKCRQVINLPHLHTAQSRAIIMMERVSAAQQRASLYSQIVASGHFGCADVKDKVYALLGIAELEEDDIVPDYSADITSLLNAVLRNEHNKMGVKKLSDVITQCEALAEAVGMDPEVVWDIGSQVSVEPSFVPSRRSPFQDESGVSILWVLKYGHTVVAKLWLQKNGWPALEKALRHAIYTRCETSWRLILDVGVDVNAERSRFSVYDFLPDAPPPDRLAEIALTSAATSGHEGTVRVLLSDAAFPGMRTETSLVNAAAAGHESIVRMLLSDRRTDVMRWTDPYCSPLHAAIDHGRVSVSGMIVHHIEDAPCGVKHKLMLNGLHRVLDCERLDGLSLLLGQLDYTELASGDDFTTYQHILLRAVQERNQYFLSQMLTALDLEALHHGGCGMRDLFMKVARLAAWTVLLQLIQKVGFGDADIDSAALVPVVLAGPDELVEQLLDLPYLDVGAVYKNLDMGAVYKKTAFSEVNTVFSAALRRRDARIAKLVLSKFHSGIDIQSFKQNLLEPLIWAFNDSRVHVNGALRALLQSDLSAHIDWNNLEGCSALCIAASRRVEVQVVDILLQQGLVDINRIASDGYRHMGPARDTALRWAIRRNHIAVVKRLLLESDIDVNLRHHESLPTTLSLARGAIANLLLEREDIGRDSTTLNFPIDEDHWSTSSQSSRVYEEYDYEGSSSKPVFIDAPYF